MCRLTAAACEKKRVINKHISLLSATHVIRARWLGTSIGFSVFYEINSCIHELSFESSNIYWMSCNWTANKTTENLRRIHANEQSTTTNRRLSTNDKRATCMRPSFQCPLHISVPAARTMAVNICVKHAPFSGDFCRSMISPFDLSSWKLTHWLVPYWKTFKPFFWYSTPFVFNLTVRTKQTDRRTKGQDP